MTIKAQHPLFEKHTVEWLRGRTGYSLTYLVDIKEGRKPARPAFRRFMASVLRKPESELFNGGKA